ncbi:MAG: hypothetical protein EPO08_15655 [Rhodospirillaceae bacterium]|nr:MAG: hypothetical protein EPO08_15655 [Rhodospirillaceae bacterium]
MPLTPFHLGPGALFKAVGGERFSFTIFGGSQVLMDVEPLVRMVRGDAALHGPSHTVLGACIIGLVSGVAGRPISETALRYLKIVHRPLTWPVSFASAFVGTYSHIALDAIMHKDMNPLWPFAVGNELLGIISTSSLYLLCVISGIFGAWIIATKTNRSP